MPLVSFQYASGVFTLSIAIVLEIFLPGSVSFLKLLSITLCNHLPSCRSCVARNGHHLDISLLPGADSTG